MLGAQVVRLLFDFDPLPDLELEAEQLQQLLGLL